MDSNSAHFKKYFRLLFWRYCQIFLNVPSINAHLSSFLLHNKTRIIQLMVSFYIKIMVQNEARQFCGLDIYNNCSYSLWRKELVIWYIATSPSPPKAIIYILTAELCGHEGKERLLMILTQNVGNPLFCHRSIKCSHSQTFYVFHTE